MQAASLFNATQLGMRMVSKGLQHKARPNAHQMQLQNGTYLDVLVCWQHAVHYTHTCETIVVISHARSILGVGAVVIS